MTTTLGIFDTAVLTRAIQALDMVPPLYFRNRYATNVQTSDGNERILFDVSKLTPRIAPFVAPHMPGKIVDEPGYETRDFKPAYVKPKRPLDTKGAFKRRAGEPLLGSMSPEERQRARLAQTLEEFATIMARREEVMLAEALRDGVTTVMGEGFDTVVVNFLRDASLTVALAGNDRWNIDHDDSNPLLDLETMSGRTVNLGAGPTTEITMDPDAWAALRTRLAQRGELPPLAQFDRSSASKFEIGPQAGNKVQYMGKIGAFDITVYNDAYIDDAGATQKFLPSGTVIGVGPENAEVTRCYGAIHDEEASFMAEQWFAKSWLEHDPGRRWVLAQSAPLVVPYRPNATWCMKVFG